MPLQSWKKLSETVLFRNRWWTYRRDTCRTPTGKAGEYHYVHTNGSSMSIPLMDDGTLLLVNQYRYLGGRESLEFPCGSVKEGSNYDETARHELIEETGYAAERLDQVGEFNPYNGVTDEMCRVYLARGLGYVGGAPDETEEFEIVRLTPSQIDEHIRTGFIWDGMTIAGWTIARPELENPRDSRGAA